MTETDPVAWLRNAHRLAEEHAQKATPGPWEPEGDDPTDDEVYTVHDGEHGDWVGGIVAFVRSGAWGRVDEGRTYGNMCLIADHAAPDAVLRRVAAERQILDEHANVNDGDCGTCVDGHWGYPTHGGSSPQPWPCRTVRHLAVGWGWTEAS